MTLYSDILKLYREKGAKALKPKLKVLIEEAINDEKASKSFRYLCSDICMDLKQFEGAIAILKTQESKHGLSDVGYNNLGYCYWECDEHESAYRAFDKSLELNPENLSSLRGAAYCSIETMRTIQSVEVCSSFYEKSGKTVEAALWYVTSLFNKGDIAQMNKILDDRKMEFGEEPLLLDFLKN